jgi:prolipoprotein diacylglyceryltransferase
VDWPAFADAMAPGLALMQAIAALGAFLTGEAYGSPSSLPWAVQIWGAARHPVQLYEAAVALGVLGVLWYVRMRKPYAGFVFGLCVLLMAMGRLFVEAFRGNPAVLAGGFRTTQVISFGVAVVALAALYTREAGLIRIKQADKK